MEKTTPLSVILWKEAQGDPTLLKACFKQDDENGRRKWLVHCCQVKDIQETDSK
jgi:hypothetical protein